MKNNTDSKFLLVSPRMPETYWSYKHVLRFIGKRALMPPLGLVTVAALLPKNISVRIVDMNVGPLRDADIAAADLVMISAMIVQKESMEDVIRRCRRLGVPVAAGGPYPSSCSDEIEGVDHFVLDEGEVTLPRFLADWQTGTLQAMYRSPEKPDLRTCPVPRFDLLDMSLYDTVPIQFSRGCPFDCEFCDIVHLFGRKPRTKPPERFLAEMDAAYATGFTGSMFIVDDNFIGNKRRVKELLQHIARWQDDHGFPFTLCTEASIDLAHDDDLLQLMVKAGFSMVFVGIESPVAESLSSAGKHQNLREDVRIGIRKIQRAGIEVTGGFIIGFDSDPPDIFDRQIEFIDDLAIPTAMIGLLMALPNTRLFDRLSREGRMLSTSTGNNTSGAALNFVPKLPAETLIAGYRRVLQTVYEPRRYFARCLKLLSIYPPREHRTAHTMRRPIRVREVTALLRSLAYQAFSRYGLSYLSYIIRGAAKRPDLVVRVVTMAVQAHHYMVVTREAFPPDGARARRRGARGNVRDWNERRAADTLPEMLEPSINRPG